MPHNDIPQRGRKRERGRERERESSPLLIVLTIRFPKQQNASAQTSLNFLNNRKKVSRPPIISTKFALRIPNEGLAGRSFVLPELLDYKIERRSRPERDFWSSKSVVSQPDLCVPKWPPWTIWPAYRLVRRVVRLIWRLHSASSLKALNRLLDLSTLWKPTNSHSLWPRELRNPARFKGKCFC